MTYRRAQVSRPPSSIFEQFEPWTEPQLNLRWTWVRCAVNFWISSLGPAQILKSSQKITWRKQPPCNIKYNITVSGMVCVRKWIFAFRVRHTCKRNLLQFRGLWILWFALLGTRYNFKENPFFIRNSYILAKKITHFGITCTCFVISLNIHLFCGPNFKRNTQVQGQWKINEDLWKTSVIQFTLHLNTNPKYSGLDSHHGLYEFVLSFNIFFLYMLIVHGLIYYTDTKAYVVFS